LLLHEGEKVFFKSRRGFLVLGMMARSRRELAKAKAWRWRPSRMLGVSGALPVKRPSGPFGVETDNPVAHNLPPTPPIRAASGALERNQRDRLCGAALSLISRVFLSVESDPLSDRFPLSFDLLILWPLRDVSELPERALWRHRHGFACRDQWPH
jgi:hypothetical protein